MGAECSSDGVNSSGLPSLDKISAAGVPGKPSCSPKAYSYSYVSLSFEIVVCLSFMRDILLKLDTFHQWQNLLFRRIHLHQPYQEYYVKLDIFELKY